jgi:cell division protein FtsB
MKTLTEQLKELTQDMLSDESLSVIEETLNKKVQIHVKKALAEQDEEYAAELDKFVNKVDKFYSARLNKIVERKDAAAHLKLIKVVEKYSKELNGGASKFKNSIVEDVSDYLDIYLEEVVPTTSIKEAVRNKKAFSILNKLRSQLGVDSAFIKEAAKDALIDGRTQITEARSELEETRKQNKVLSEKLRTLETQQILSEKCAKFSPKKRSYLNSMFKESNAKFINENFDYALSLFDKKEENRIDDLRNEALQTRTVKQDSIITENDSRDVAPKKQQPQKSQKPASLGDLYISQLTNVK